MSRVSTDHADVRLGDITCQRSSVQTNSRAVSAACVVVIVGVAAWVTGCGGEVSDDSGHRNPTRASTYRLDLADDFDHAIIASRGFHLSFEHGSDARFLSSGWHGLRHGNDGSAYAVAGARNAVVDVPLAEPTEMRARLRIEAAHQFKKHGLRVAIHWNGTPISNPEWKNGQFEATVGVRDVEFVIPANRVRRGLNQLEFLPSYWLTPEKELDGGKPNSESIRCYEIAIEPISGGATDAAVSRVEDSIAQAPGSAATWFFVVPDAATFRGRVSVDPAARDTHWGTARVTLALAEGEPLQVASIDLASRPDARFVDDLSPYAGEMAALTISYSPAKAPRAGATQPASILWQEMMIEGTRTGLAKGSALASSAQGMNVLVILLDTLRADHTEPYGATNTATPEIAKLAEGGVTFTRAYSSASWTLPAIGSLFTSLRPGAHGLCCHNQRLTGEFPVMAEVLQRAGYRTIAIFNNAIMTPGFGTEGMDRGFDVVHNLFSLHWEDFRQTHPTPESQADFVWDQYVKGPANHAADQPFFVYLHEYDPHTPYEPLPPFDAMYDTGLGESFNVELHSYASFWLINSHAMGLTRGEVAQFKAMYRGEISFMDRYVGRIMERLRESGLENKTLVVFLSDHGEEFMEHGRMGHTDSVFDELLRIPLIFSLPGVLPEGRRPETPVEIIDVPTTIYDLLGIESPSPVQGVSLLSALDAPDDFALARPTFGQWVRQPGPGNPAPAVSYDSVRLGNWKLVRNVLDHDRPDEMQYELYDTANDPDEIVNLWANRPVIGRTLAVMIERQLEIDRAYRRSKSTPAENQAVDPEVLERLRSLGYGGQ